MVVAEKHYYSSLTIGQKSSNLEMDYKCAVPTTGMGLTVHRALKQAKMENRLIIGLSNAVQVLSKTPEDAFICLMATSVGDNDSATHMHEILLSAFCYENDIYTIKVDDSKKLSRILGINRIESCVLILKSWADGHKECFTRDEDSLIDYCEEFWDVALKPTVFLPE